MPTNTSGGTTTSFMNTPQAVDDFYKVVEDCIYTFDVMANDLGGNAKILWSIDDTNLDGTYGVTASGDGTYDLLKQDAALCPEKSDKGARIWIEAGKIKYDASVFNYLGVGQCVTDMFTYAIRLSNGTLSWATVTITVTGTNDGPVANADTATTAEDNSVTINVLANDTDPDTSDTLSVTGANVTTGLGSASVVDNKVVYNPGTAYNYLAVGETASVVITYAISDGHGGTSSATATVTVTGTNDAPTANADTATTAEDNSVTINVLANDTDPDTSDTLSVTGANVTTGLGSASVVDNKVVYNPGTAYNYLAVGETASVVITYAISDGHGGTSSATATVTVTGTNDAPTVEQQIGNQSTNEDAVYSYDASANFDDVDASDTLTYSAELSNGDPLPSWLSIDPTTGVLSGTPDNGDVGSYTITVTATDDEGETASSTFELMVDNVNDAPTASATNSVTTNEDTASSAVAIGAADMDGDTLAYSIKAGSGPAHGGVTFNPVNGTFVYTPVGNYAGSDTFTIVISDGNGGTVEQVVGVTVNPVNDAPVATAVTLTAIAEDSGPRIITSAELLAGVTDIDGPTPTITALSIAPGSSGTLVSNANGTWTYTPALDDDTSVTFNYTASDGSLTASSTATMDITPVAEFVYVSPPVYTGTGDPNDFDGLGNPLGTTITGGNGSDTLYGGAGSDTITGGNGDDTIYAGSGNDSVNGGTQGDTLYGGSGNDTIVGDQQDDRIIGGYGADNLTGGNGADTFVYLSNRDTGDTITDFVRGSDHIDLNAFAPTTWAGQLTQAGAVGPNQVGYMISNGVTTIYVDTDGVIGADLEIRLTGSFNLDGTDFLGLTP